MSITVTLSTGLRAFIIASLKRGQPPAAVIEALIGNRVEARIAKGAVDAFLSAQAASLIGWRPEFPRAAVMVCERLELVESQSLSPLGIMQLLRFVKKR